jgi:hypothetical protein
MAKTWREKHDGHKHPVQIETLDKPFAGKPPGATMVIATPKDMTAFFKSVPRGKSRSMDDLRAHLAKKHKTDFACPLTTGIFSRIAAEHAYAQIAEGESANAVAPFWRVIDPKSPLAKKLACGPDFISRMRAEEGIADAPPPVRKKAASAKPRAAVKKSAPGKAAARSRKSV